MQNTLRDMINFSYRINCCKTEHDVLLESQKSLKETFGFTNAILYLVDDETSKIYRYDNHGNKQ